MDDLKLERIAQLIREGFHAGRYLDWSWSLETEEGLFEDESAIEVIADLVAKGFREGHYPRWVLRL